MYPHHMVIRVTMQWDSQIRGPGGVPVPLLAASITLLTEKWQNEVDDEVHHVRHLCFTLWHRMKQLVICDDTNIVIRKVTDFTHVHLSKHKVLQPTIRIYVHELREVSIHPNIIQEIS